MKRKLLLSALMSLMLVGSAWAQRTITGTVIDAVQGGLPGATVQVKGTNTGTTTDLEGKYSITVPEGSEILVFRFVGYTTKEETIDNRTTIDVTLAEDILGEVIITAIGIAKEKKALGYAVQDISGSELIKAPDGNALNNMSGKLAGVQVINTSGTVGGPTNVIIRGMSSVNGNNQPLYVIDGIPINNSTFRGTTNTRDGAAVGNAAIDINPNDIESMSVLKGPSATALYGSRAANGVIIITTKKGTGKKLSVEFNSSATFSSPLLLPQYQNEYAQGLNGQYEIIDASWGPRIGSADSKGVTDWKGDVVDLVARPDNIKDFYETGENWVNSISIAGSGQDIDYRLGYTNFTQTGILPNTDLTRNTFTFNAGGKLAPKLTVRSSASYVRSNSDNLGVQGQGGASIPIMFMWAPRTLDWNELKDYRNSEGTQDPLNIQRKWINYFDNPHFALEENTFSQDRNRLIGNVEAGYDILSWLTFTARLGADVYSDSRRQLYAVGSDDRASGGFYEDNYNVRNINTDLLLTINRKLSEDINLTAIIGNNSIDNRTKRLFFDGTGLITPDFYSASNLENITDRSNTLTEYRLYGIFTTVDLSYRNYLFLTVSARNDWSSTLPKDNNSFFYPSISSSFVFSDAFDLNDEILSFGKVRASWGQAGRDATPYQLASTYSRPVIDNFPANNDINFPFNGTPGFTVGSSIGNPTLSPEITTSYEFGLDLRFLDNRLGVDLTYYNANSRDQIINVTIPESTGYSTLTLNAGDIRNRGIELAITGTPIRTASGFSWNTMLNYTRNRNEVLKTYNDTDLSLGGGQVLRVGEAFGSWFGPDYARTDDGRAIINPNTGLPAVSSESTIQGNTNPDFMLGFQNEFNFKGFQLSFLFDIRQGGKFRSLTTSVLRYAGQVEETLANRETPFVLDGVIDNGDGTFLPNDIEITAEQYWEDRIFDLRATLLDASFIKLRELRLGYSLPKSVVSRTPFKAISVAIVGRNLWMQSESKHVDPELATIGTVSNIMGYEYGSIPSTKSLGVNLRVAL
ncbi:SusC/RagA family TonB-linked outer membrane protein [Bernardetia sp. MNP-M8]|uniref:SusC/RagA family TonB-linked outer membrane protein n=1 Tax=Bernardetia sp. MNP-M8 TaxID=3127470 RepID=UPI0030D332E5